MLDKSKEIYMFCGELSILQRSFQKYVEERIPMANKL